MSLGFTVGGGRCPRPLSHFAMNPSRTISLVLASASLLAWSRAEVVDIGNRKQLFLDQKFVAESSGVELRMNPPIKTGAGPVPAPAPGTTRVLSSYWHRAGGRWESFDCGIRGPVAAHPLQVDRARGRICYAESDDGLHWTKPNLGLFDWGGSKANNVLMQATPESCRRIHRSQGAAGRTAYKIVGRLLAERGPRVAIGGGKAPAGGGLYMYTSRDGP